MKVFRFLIFLLLVFNAATSFAAQAGAWHWTAGYGFLSNTDDIKDTYRHRLNQEKHHVHIYNTSVNLIVAPYYQWQNGFRAGIGAGPLILLIGDAYHLQVPMNATLGYSYLNAKKIIPYFRTGVSYHPATGDYYAGSSAGFYGAAGVKLFKAKSIQLGFETAYDGARIAIDPGTGKSGHEKIKTGEVTFYLYADF